MRKNLTEIVFILDRSGSMRGLEADTIGGYNALIDKQKKEAFSRTALFPYHHHLLVDYGAVSVLHTDYQQLQSACGYSEGSASVSRRK